MTLQAYLSRRVVTPEGIRPAAILVEGEKIQAVVSPEQVPSWAETHDFGNAAILPGLVDTHVHMNDPGGAGVGRIRDWQPRSRSRRLHDARRHAAECLPGTTDVKAVEAKRSAARARCRTDWAVWGGVVADNQAGDRTDGWCRREWFQVLSSSIRALTVSR